MYARIATICVLLAASLVMVGCGHRNDTEKPLGRPEILGWWKCVAWLEEDGESEDALNSTFAFTDKHIVISRKDGSSMTCQYSLDTAAEPWLLDISTEHWFLDLKPQPRPRVVKGIARLNDDVMTICLAGPDGNRPEDFNIGEKSDKSVAKFVRTQAIEDCYAP